MLENTLSRPKLYAMILTRLVYLILNKSSLEDCNSLLFKTGIDVGGSFLEFYMSIFDINNLAFKNESGLSKKFRDSRVKSHIFDRCCSRSARELREHQNRLDQFGVAKGRLQMSHSISHPCC